MSNFPFNNILEAVANLRNFEAENNSSDDDDATEAEQDTDTGEVDEGQESSTMGEAESRGQQNFDTNITSLHSYLGAELEIVRGRTVLEDDAVVGLDLLKPYPLILMPGQTLPLTVFDSSIINMLQNCIRNDRTFGVLASWTEGEENHKVTSLGTTAEIYEYLPQEGNSGFRIKAKARQRFKVLTLDQSGNWKARVLILPEVRLSDPLNCVKLQSLQRLRSSPSKHLRCRRADAALTRWPTFVYEQYNIKRLLRDIKEELSASLLQEEKYKATAKVNMPEDPTELSFWVAQNLPLTDKHRVLLLKLNSPIQRLRFELHALKMCQQVLCCEKCRVVIGSRADMFCMSSEGPQGTYVNPGGFLHETVTLSKVQNITSLGYPSTEFSWFPGYAWIICKCRHCGQHMGWKFKATTNQLKPKKFWGLCRRSFSIEVGAPQESEDNKQPIIF